MNVSNFSKEKNFRSVDKEDLISHFFFQAGINNRRLFGKTGENLISNRASNVTEGGSINE